MSKPRVRKAPAINAIPAIEPHTGVGTTSRGLNALMRSEFARAVTLRLDQTRYVGVDLERANSHARGKARFMLVLTGPGGHKDHIALGMFAFPPISTTWRLIADRSMAVLEAHTVLVAEEPEPEEEPVPEPVKSFKAEPVAKAAPEPVVKPAPVAAEPAPKPEPAPEPPEEDDDEEGEEEEAEYTPEPLPEPPPRYQTPKEPRVPRQRLATPQPSPLAAGNQLDPMTRQALDDMRGASSAARGRQEALNRIRHFAAAFLKGDRATAITIDVTGEITISRTTVERA